MPRVTLSPSQLASAREIAEKAARVMEEKPESFCREMARTRTWDLRALRIDRKWWRWSTQDDWTPYFALDGTDPAADAYACHLMKERLIEWFPRSAHETNYCAIRGVDRCWYCAIDLHAYKLSPLEALAVAQALIAVDEQRRREGK